MENKDEDAIVRKWGEAEEAEREREKQAKAGAGGKRKRGAGKEGDGARLQIEGPKVVEISEEDAELLSAAKRAKENKEFQRRFIEIKRREFEENRALRNEEEDQAERELFRKEQEEKELRTHLWDKLIDQADLPRPRRRFART